MDRRLVLAIVLATAVLSGCSGKAATPTSSEATTSESASTSSQSGPVTYPALAPEGAAESKAVANIGESYKAYLAMAENNLKQDANTVVFRNEANAEPRFIGYAVTGSSDKLTDGKFNMGSVIVLDGKVTTEGAWNKPGELTTADVNPQYFVYQVPSVYVQAIEATTQRQKDAVAKAQAWFGANFSDKQLSKFQLTGLVFAWGQPGDEHGLVLQVNPDSPASVISNAW